eukprot:CAMPEP_0177615952 /NCGR_PEP_ID=MMETSP0419_2-20121207/23820_1 /TAXON_ID=582737 /ORGANISM="Tetraselmis sp., Strain GSL018" /LENGTH=259 /DNA_ID=CAMNT_0019113825 /DNA_START=311 /DNA_END=1090 /DNA_ORIENTATION=-
MNGREKETDPFIEDLEHAQDGDTVDEPILQETSVPSASCFDTEAEQRSSTRKHFRGPGDKPWFVWLLLSAGVCAVSSAGAVFASMPTVPPVLLASWRLQLTAVVLLLARWREDAPGGQATVEGDLSSLLGAAAMVGYLAIGRALRGSEMPLFVYAAPVTATAPPYLGKVVYLALGPGLLGHTGFNYLLTWLSPLVISLALTLEPLVGSLIGWLAGVSAPPTVLSFVGGFILMSSMAVVTISSHARETRARAMIDMSLEA